MYAIKFVVFYKTILIFAKSKNRDNSAYKKTILIDGLIG